MDKKSYCKVIKRNQFVFHKKVSMFFGSQIPDKVPQFGVIIIKIFSKHFYDILTIRIQNEELVPFSIFIPRFLIISTSLDFHLVLTYPT